MITKTQFGYTAGGREVTEFILDNGNIRAHILDYGCILRRLFVRGKDGNFRDVVLGYDNVSGYEENGGYSGAFIGRVANRIGGAKFTLNGIEYKLYNNDGANSLHGGNSGFNQKIYYHKIDGDKLTFFGVSPDGEENYPGNLQVEICYFLSDNGIEIEYFAETDKDTPINLTNHSYFNLSGEDTILNHFVRINSDYITPVDKTLIPTGKLLLTENTPFDFHDFKRVGKRIDVPHKQLEYAGGYDHNFVLKNYGAFEKVVEAYSDVSGIKMDVLTDNYGVQFYSGNFLSGQKGKDNEVYSRRKGMCFETQNFPNAVNQISFPSAILKANNTFKSRTAYRFSIAENL